MFRRKTTHTPNPDGFQWADRQTPSKRANWWRRLNKKWVVFLSAVLIAYLVLSGTAESWIYQAGRTWHHWFPGNSQPAESLAKQRQETGISPTPLNVSPILFTPQADELTKEAALAKGQAIFTALGQQDWETLKTQFGPNQAAFDIWQQLAQPADADQFQCGEAKISQEWGSQGNQDEHFSQLLSTPDGPGKPATNEVTEGDDPFASAYPQVAKARHLAVTCPLKHPTAQQTEFKIIMVQSADGWWPVLTNFATRVNVSTEAIYGVGSQILINQKAIALPAKDQVKNFDHQAIRDEIERKLDLGKPASDEADPRKRRNPQTIETVQYLPAGNYQIAHHFDTQLLATEKSQMVIKPESYVQRVVLGQILETPELSTALNQLLARKIAPCQEVEHPKGACPGLYHEANYDQPIMHYDLADSRLVSGISMLASGKASFKVPHYISFEQDGQRQKDPRPPVFVELTRVTFGKDSLDAQVDW
ncbi:hypothetical protein BK816_07990 [Boudabousia tangfeifanii]|uniref:Uncharacterized protein n=1 Tax=Boudabousia tangfeifanii TaxID=1912795 RepID=A0A1D9MM43_9ACTO|nr:hypothetical protein [Boudabousia tangfeifanii]AOZ73233.1 hypothetical protein BK816_07990 [Boudabousia tangfeifanii]